MQNSTQALANLFMHSISLFPSVANDITGNDPKIVDFRDERYFEVITMPDQASFEKEKELILELRKWVP